jgi:hypothetical protein
VAYSGDYAYQWSAWNGGNIVSGANTPNPTVNAAGNYTVQVSDVVTTCAGFSTAIVSANQDLPTSEAGPGMEVSCASPSVELEGSGSVGANISYQWTAINGGHIEAGANTLTPTVDAAGNYILVVTNSANGCAKSDTTGVVGNNVPPTAQTESDDLTCVTFSVTLNAITNANNPVFAWTGPNGFTSDLQNPVTTEAGDYQLMVSDPKYRLHQYGFGCCGKQYRAAWRYSRRRHVDLCGFKLLNWKAMQMHPAFRLPGPARMDLKVLCPTRLFRW